MGGLRSGDVLGVGLDLDAKTISIFVRLQLRRALLHSRERWGVEDDTTHRPLTSFKELKLKVRLLYDNVLRVLFKLMA